MRAFAILLALAGAARADRWTAGDTFAEVGVGLVLAGDLLQTRQICADIAAGTNPAWVHETNVFIGPQCERMPPELYFPLVLGTHVLLARLMPRPFRRAFQLMAIAVWIDPIKRNLAAGYTFRW